MVGKKRAHQPGYKPAKDSLGRTTWVPDGSHVKSKMESMERLREYSDSITEEYKKIEGVKKESISTIFRDAEFIDFEGREVNSSSMEEISLNRFDYLPYDDVTIVMDGMDESEKETLQSFLDLHSIEYSEMDDLQGGVRTHLHASDFFPHITPDMVGELESMVDSSRKPPKVDRDRERLNELFALADKHNKQIRNLVTSVFDGASFESTETGNSLDANYVEEYVGEPFAFENEVDDFTIDFSYLDDKRKGVIRDMCHKYEIPIDNDTIFASEFFEVARDNIDDVENINLQF